jgi:hypothetical protein
VARRQREHTDIEGAETTAKDRTIAIVSAPSLLVCSRCRPATVALSVLSVRSTPTWPCECYRSLSPLCPCPSEMSLLFLLILSMSPTSNLRCRLCTVAMVVLLLLACHGRSHGAFCVFLPNLTSCYQSVCAFYRCSSELSLAFLLILLMSPT